MLIFIAKKKQKRLKNEVRAWIHYKLCNSSQFAEVNLSCFVVVKDLKCSIYIFRRPPSMIHIYHCSNEVNIYIVLY